MQKKMVETSMGSVGLEYKIKQLNEKVANSEEKTKEMEREIQKLEEVNSQ